MKPKAHPDYFLKSGKQVESVTQILKVLSKDGLAPAANKLGLQNINSNTYWKELAEQGSIAHHLILCHLKKVKPDVSEYKKEWVDKAENSFLSYLEWEKHHKVEPILLETPLVSELWEFGGSPDCVCHLDESDYITLIDFKTGGIYLEHDYQMGGYDVLLWENGYLIDNALILSIPRTVDENFDERPLNKGMLVKAARPFMACLHLYKAIKDYKLTIK